MTYLDSCQTSVMERFWENCKGLKNLHPVNFVKFDGVLSAPLSNNFWFCFKLGFTCSKLTIKTLEQGVKYVQN